MRQGSSCNFRFNPSTLILFLDSGCLRLMACPRVPTQGGFDGDLKEECMWIHIEILGKGFNTRAAFIHLPQLSKTPKEKKKKKRKPKDGFTCPRKSFTFYVS